MKGKFLYSILTIFVIVLLYFGFSTGNEDIKEVVMLIAGTIIGYLLTKFLEYLEDIEFLLFIQSLIHFNSDIRVSYAYLFKIEIDGSYFLVRGNNKKKFQPVGGVYQYYDSAKSFLRNIFDSEDEMKKNTRGNDNDLRGKVKGKDLKKFQKWFDSNQDREITCEREFKEELIKTGILNKELFNEIQFCYLGTNKTKIFKTSHYGYELLLANIYELLITAEQKEEFRKLKKIYDAEIDNSKLPYAFVSGEEIRRQYTSKRATEDYELDINNHTYKILKGEYK